MKAFQKLWQLLTPAERRSAVVLFVLMLMGMVLETLGIGMVIPALAVMTSQDIASSFPGWTRIAGWLGNPSRQSIVIGGMLALVAVYALKALFLVFLVWRQMSFTFTLQASMSQRLFSLYLHQQYKFHLTRNSAQLIRNCVGEVDLLTKMGIMAGLTLLTEILIMLGISVLLIIVEPLGAGAVLGAVGLSVWGFYQFTHNRLLQWGKTRQMHEGRRIQHLQQGLAGIKDVKVSGREAAFLSEYAAHSRGSARAAQLQASLQQFPRLVLEVLAVAALAALVLIMMWQGRSPDALLPTLGLFAAAAFRIMPSANRAIGAIQNVRYSLPVIDLMHKELLGTMAPVAAGPSQPLPFHDALSLTNVTYRYPGAEADALNNVSLVVPCGSSVGFIGGSGAGKSTLIDVILGLLAPGVGTVRVDDTDIQANLRGWQNQIGYVPQAVFLTDDTLRRNVAFGLANDDIDDKSVWQALRAAQLEAYVNELPEGLSTMVGERGIRLSGGQLQRVGIARALYHDPTVLVLDEATSSLDVDTERGVMEAVRALHGRKTTLIVAHRLSTVEHCDRLFRLEHGHLVAQGMPVHMLAEIRQLTHPDEIRLREANAGTS